MRKLAEDKSRRARLEKEQARLGKIESEKEFLQRVHECYLREAEEKARIKAENERKIEEMERLEASLVEKLHATQ